MKREIGGDVKVIEYSQRVDFWNCLTHAVAAAASVFATAFLVNKVEGTREIFSAVVYGISLIAVCSVSAVYHGLKIGEAKRIARIIDHSTVPLLIAGTATPCALISLYEISHIHGLTVFIMGWGCTLFGIFSKIFFFEKLKKVTAGVYIICGSIMLFSALFVIEEIDKGAFGQLVLGAVIYVIGALLCALGAKKEELHIIFHILVVIAAAIHFYAIYVYVF